jgi:hypothetical protein
MSTANNINKRIQNTTQNIARNQNKSVGQMSLRDKLQPYTKGFMDLIKGKPQSTINNKTSTLNSNKNKNTKPEESSPFDNPIILISVVAIALLFMGYGLYKFMYTSSKVQQGKTYYGKNLTEYEPVFKMNTTKIEDCINRCNLDTMCNGVTFDDEAQQCVGTKDGRLRNDSINFNAWVKSDEENIEVRTGKLVGYANGLKVVNNQDIPKPKLPTEFNYSFYLYIEDFYDNQGSWKHIMHKGTGMEDIKKIDTPNWNDVSMLVPEQTIGVWCAPYNNNIRIAVTTMSQKHKKGKTEYKHAYQQKTLSNPDTNGHQVFVSDNTGGKFRDPTRNEFSTLHNGGEETTNPFITTQQVEYIDIYRIPIKKLVHISVNFTGMTMEVYMNGNLYKIHTLSGTPIFNNGDLFCMMNKTITGSIIDLKFTPERITHSKIKDIISNMKSLENRTLQQIRKIAK